MVTNSMTVFLLPSVKTCMGLIEPDLKFYSWFVTIKIVNVASIVENDIVMVLVVNEIANNHCLTDFDQSISLGVN